MIGYHAISANGSWMGRLLVRRTFLFNQWPGMAVLRAHDNRQQRLSTLGLQYPLWLFDIDDPRWPRRLDSLLPESYPAKISGWYAYTSEYEMHMVRRQDLPQAQKKDTKPQDLAYYTGLAQDALQQLRYDDRYNLERLQAVVRENTGQSAVRLSSWIFDAHGTGWISPSKVVRIERAWDHVPLWDPALGLERLSDCEAMKPYFGVATLMTNDGDLLAATGMPKTCSGEQIRKAEFERLDTPELIVDGIVCPSRERATGDHGLAVNVGPKYVYNRRLIAGTALQDADWELVVEYNEWRRGSPLL